MKRVNCKIGSTMRRTTLVFILLGIATFIIAPPAFAGRDPGAGPESNANSVTLYDYANNAQSSRVSQNGHNNQYDDGMNLYQYERSNPVNNVDPAGLYSGKCPDFKEKCGCALSSECSVGNCLQARKDSSKAASAAAARYPKSLHNGKGDAWRHCYWNCLMTRSVGKPCAKRVADNHEDCGDRYGQPATERLMDEHNNHKGRKLASKQGSCADLCKDALDNGDLKVLNP